MSNTRSFNKFDLLIGAGIVAYLCFLCIFSGNVANHYQITDTHDDLVIVKDIERNGFWEAAKNELEFRMQVRFLPVYTLVRTAKAYLFGTNWGLFYAYNLVLGIVAMFSLYLFGRKIGFSIIASIVWSYFCFIGPESWFNQATIFYRIASAELLGMAVLGVALLFLAKSAERVKTLNPYEVVFWVLIVMLTLIKESFMLLTPALWFGKAWLYSRNHEISIWHSAKKHLPQGALIILVAIIEFAILKFAIGGIDKMGYVGVSSSAMGMLQEVKTTAKTFLSTELVLSLSITVLGASLVLFAQKHLPESRSGAIKEAAAKLWPQALLVGMVVVPQLVVYAKSGIYERYKFPVILGLAYLLALLVHQIFAASQRQVLVKLFVAAILLLAFYRNTVNAYANATAYARDATNVSNTLDKVSDCKQGRILIVADPVLQFESTISLVRYFELNENCESVYVVPVSIGKNETAFASKDAAYHEKLEAEQAQTLSNNYTTDPGLLASGFQYVIYNLEEHETLFLQKQPWYRAAHDSINAGPFKLLLYK